MKATSQALQARGIVEPTLVLDEAQMEIKARDTLASTPISARRALTLSASDGFSNAPACRK